jgi:hypothetical protein
MVLHNLQILFSHTILVVCELVNYVGKANFTVKDYFDLEEEIGSKAYFERDLICLEFERFE